MHREDTNWEWRFFADLLATSDGNSSEIGSHLLMGQMGRFPHRIARSIVSADSNPIFAEQEFLHGLSARLKSWQSNLSGDYLLAFVLFDLVQAFLPTDGYSAAQTAGAILMSNPAYFGQRPTGLKLPTTVRDLIIRSLIVSYDQRATSIVRKAYFETLAFFVRTELDTRGGAQAFAELLAHRGELAIDAACQYAPDGVESMADEARKQCKVAIISHSTLRASLGPRLNSFIFSSASLRQHFLPSYTLDDNIADRYALELLQADPMGGLDAIMVGMR
jgi:hypothetical protein